MDSVGEELERLARLRASGDLTVGEFEILKARLIGTEPNAPAPSEQIPVPTTEGAEEDRVEDVVGYEMADWTSEDKEAFSEVLAGLGVPYSLDECGDLVVWPADEETVDQALKEFFDTADEWVDPDKEADEVGQDADSISFEAWRAEHKQSSAEPEQETALQPDEDQAKQAQDAALASLEARGAEQTQGAEVSSPSRPSSTTVERTAPTPDLTGWGSREGALKVVAIGCAVMAVAAFLPWVSFRGRDVSFSLTGIEARGAEPFPADVGDGFFVGDGFVTLALGVYGLVLALVAIKRRWGRVLPLEPMSVGLFVLLLVVFEILDISGEPFASMGFGLVLTVCSGLVVASASVLALIRPGDRPYRRINEEGAPCCWYCGGTAFHRKRVKWYFLRFGLFALFAKKRYKCEMCGEYNRPGSPVPLGTLKV